MSFISHFVWNISHTILLTRQYKVENILLYFCQYFTRECKICQRLFSKTNVSLAVEDILCWINPITFGDPIWFKPNVKNVWTNMTMILPFSPFNQSWNWDKMAFNIDTNETWRLKFVFVRVSVTLQTTSTMKKVWIRRRPDKLKWPEKLTWKMQTSSKCMCGHFLLIY